MMKTMKKNNSGCCGKPLKYNDPRRKKINPKKLIKRKIKS